MVSGGGFWFSSSFVFIFSSFPVYLSVCCVNHCSLFFFLLVLGGFCHPGPETCHQFFVEKDRKGIFVGKFRVRGHIYIYISISLSLSLPVSVSRSLSLSLSMSQPLSLSLSLLSVCVCLCLSVSVCLCLSLSFSLSICLSVCLSLSLSLSLFFGSRFTKSGL